MVELRLAPSGPLPGRKRQTLHLVMSKRKPFSRAFLLFALLTLLCAGVFTPRVEEVRAKPNTLVASNVVISEFRTRGPSVANAATDEFIELYNPTSNPIDISGWEIHGSNNIGGGTTTPRVVIPSTPLLQPGQYYLIANNDYSGATVPNLTYGTGIADDGGIALTLANDTPVDQVGMSVNSAYKEGTILPQLSLSVDQSYERMLGGSNANCLDNNVNSTDFFLNSNSSNPQNLSSPTAFCIINVSSSSTNGVYISGNSISIDITFNGIVTVTGIPTLMLETGNINTSATYSSGNGTNILTFDYLVAATDVSGDLDYVSSNSLSLSGGTITSTTGSVSLVLPDPNTLGSLGSNKDIVIDNQIPPSVTINQAIGQADPTSTLPINFAVVFSEPINVGTFTTADISIGSSTATGITWSILDSGDHMNFTLSATTVAGYGTLIPSIAAGQVEDTVAQTNPLPSVSLDNTVTYANLATFTPTPTPTTTATNTPAPAGVLSVLINEVAWAGTSSARSGDEWIELYNTESVERSLDGWRLTIDDSSDQSNEITLATFGPGEKILPGNFFILARATSGNYDIFTNVIEDKSFTTSIPNTGIIILRLYSAQNTLIDTANSGKNSGWYAGTASSTYATMERRSGKPLDSSNAWQTFGGTPFALNRDNASVRGTPKRANSVLAAATATRTRTPAPVSTAVPVVRPIINEFLPRPGFDWNGDGSVDVFDEFIEIKNIGIIDVNLGGWKLDDMENSGSNPFTLPSVTLKPGERIVFYGLETNLLLSDGGDAVRLLNPSNKVYDSYTYKIAKVEDESFCRMVDGIGNWYEDCTPTPTFTNTRDGDSPSMPDGSGFESPVCGLPDTLPEAFLIAECRGYGANLWSAIYWDAKGWETDRFVPENMSKWESFVE